MDEPTIGELFRAVARVEAVAVEIRGEVRKTNGRVNGLEAREGMTQAQLARLDEEIRDLKDRPAAPAPSQDTITIPITSKTIMTLLLAVAGLALAAFGLGVKVP